ncbi:hypothetical protein [Amycolatopsis magusensis]|uniref:Uncharacterized protein n=1 Tax=Amycolatopsis magusensis TaxID=882444 RepID=A0ABS4PZU6_9PSEU|nr:hypothetical protein [Amycolatopsis magusensis]MBP2184828.1 hypothetical protein [Amycolatopsis magusensis]MDI5979016.1 hypothetical protein [Amycolatopsis magusensis]
MAVREGKQGTDEEPTPIYDSVAGEQGGREAERSDDPRAQAGDK